MGGFDTNDVTPSGMTQIFAPRFLIRYLSLLLSYTVGMVGRGCR